MLPNSKNLLKKKEKNKYKGGPKPTKEKEQKTREEENNKKHPAKQTMEICSWEHHIHP